MYEDRATARTEDDMTINTNAIDVRGAIDCNGHILEPPDLWEKYLEPRYRDRAIRIRMGNDGRECFVWFR